MGIAMIFKTLLDSHYRLVDAVMRLDQFSLGLLALLVLMVIYAGMCAISSYLIMCIEKRNLVLTRNGLQGAKSMADLEQARMENSRGLGRVFLTEFMQNLHDVRGNFLPAWQQAEGRHHVNFLCADASALAHQVVESELKRRMMRLVVVGRLIAGVSLWGIVIYALMSALRETSWWSNGASNDISIIVLLFLVIGVWGVAICAVSHALVLQKMCRCSVELKRLGYRVIRLLNDAAEPS